MSLKKFALVAVVLLAAVISFTIIAPWAADSVNHVSSIEKTSPRLKSLLIFMSFSVILVIVDFSMFFVSGVAASGAIFFCSGFILIPPHSRPCPQELPV